VKKKKKKSISLGEKIVSNIVQRFKSPEDRNYLMVIKTSEKKITQEILSKVSNTQ